MFMPANITPSPTTTSQSLRLRPRSRGRENASRITAAMTSRNVTAPVGPTYGNSFAANAAPNWIEHALARTSITARPRCPGRSRSTKAGSARGAESVAVREVILRHYGHRQAGSAAAPGLLRLAGTHHGTQRDRHRA